LHRRRGHLLKFRPAERQGAQQRGFRLRFIIRERDHLAPYDAKDGVWVADLAEINDPLLIAEAIASTMSVREDPARVLTEALIEALRPKSRLLIVDNCEHLTAACAALAHRILKTCPGIRILAISRESLNIKGETVCDVPSPTAPDAQALPPAPAIGDYESVQLFVDPVGAASSLNNLAINASAKGDYAAAVHLLQEAAVAIRSAGDESRPAHILDNLAATFLDSGDLAAARGPLQEALLLFDKTGDLWGKALALRNLGQICLRERDLRRASTYNVQSLDIRMRLQNIGGALTSLLTLSDLLREIGHFNDSVRLYSAALALSKSCEQALSATLLRESQSNLEALASPAPGFQDLVDHWDLAFFDQPGSQNRTTVYAGQNNSGANQTSVIVAVLLFPDQARLIRSCSSAPKILSVTP
jgi:tetratricopeptide (TPR) repeat protein